MFHAAYAPIFNYIVCVSCFGVASLIPSECKLVYIYKGRPCIVLYGLKFVWPNGMLYSLQKIGHAFAREYLDWFSSLWRMFLRHSVADFRYIGRRSRVGVYVGVVPELVIGHALALFCVTSRYVDWLLKHILNRELVRSFASMGSAIIPFAGLLRVNEGVFVGGA